ncbi:alcohol oxidase [Neoconidiobolus thromboides FSU 785]|nr:alcohol oxidase [Neoconidiobolus thromboides FSU 785]
MLKLVFLILNLTIVVLCQKSNDYRNNNNGKGSTNGNSNSSNNNNKRSQYDYIVVGAGAAGSITAVGLAEKGFSVLLIEAGQDYASANVTTPALHVRSSEDPNISWDFMVKHYEEKTNLRQSVLYPKASGIGGCTLHNAMLHILPHYIDYQNMVDLTGDDSWSESNMMNYYQNIAQPQMLERLPPVRLFNQLGTLFQSISTFTTNLLSEKGKGWLKLSNVNIFNLLANDPKLSDLVSKILGAPLISSILGFDINSYIAGRNPNAESRSFLVPINADVSQGMQRTGVYERVKWATKNMKLTVLTNSLVSRVLLDNDNSAYGVEYLQGEHIYKASKYSRKANYNYQKVYCNNEVIVSGGTFNTPQIMMLSGIGDPNHLKSLNIEPRVNLPGVGRNLHDRYEISVNFKFNANFTILNDCLMEGSNDDPCFNRFKQGHSGPYTFNGVLAAVTKKSNEKLKVPDLLTLIAPIYFTGYHHGMGDEVYMNKNILSFLILKAHTFNRAGRILLNSNDPTDVPDINFNYFKEGANEDLPAMIKGIRDVRNLMKDFSNENVEVIPGENVQTDQQLSDYILKSSWGHHATGTMKIGRQGDPYAVLDSQFRVKGTKNLRVVDLSILPDIPGYFPVLYLYMIGAKAADTIAAAVASN